MQENGCYQCTCNKLELNEIKWEAEWDAANVNPYPVSAQVKPISTTAFLFYFKKKSSDRSDEFTLAVKQEEPII